jgi:hypothetical protein
MLLMKSYIKMFLHPFVSIMEPILYKLSLSIILIVLPSTSNN